MVSTGDGVDDNYKHHLYPESLACSSMYCCRGDILGSEGDLVLPPSGNSVNCCSLARAFVEARPFHFFTWRQNMLKNIV